MKQKPAELYEMKGVKRIIDVNKDKLFQFVATIETVGTPIIILHAEKLKPQDLEMLCDHCMVVKVTN